VQGFLPAVYKIHNLIINYGGDRPESLIHPGRGRNVKVIGGSSWTRISEQYLEAGHKGLFPNHYLLTMMIFPISSDDI
jgi:hypothetical protein